MKKLLSTIVTLILLTFVSNSSFSAGDEAIIKKLSSMYKSGDTTQAIVVEQDTKFAANVKKNILFNFKNLWKISNKKHFLILKIK